MSGPEVLLSGLGIPESPRWHEGRLWFCNCGGPDRRTLFIMTSEWRKADPPGLGTRHRPAMTAIDWYRAFLSNVIIPLNKVNLAIRQGGPETVSRDGVEAAWVVGTR